MIEYTLVCKRNVKEENFSPRSGVDPRAEYGGIFEETDIRTIRVARKQCRNEARRSLYHCTPRADRFARRRRFLPTFNLTARSGPFSPKSPSRARRACKNDSEGPSRTARALGYSPINPYIDPLPFSLLLALPLSPYRLGERKSSWLV